MNRFLTFLLLVVSTFVASAANPTLENFDQTHFRTNNPPPGIIRTRLSSSNFDQSGDTWSITNVSGATGASLWTNDLDGFMRVIPGNAINGIETTNHFIQKLLYQEGAMVWNGVLNSNLVAGLNELTPYEVNSLRLTGSSGTPSDSTVTLSGAHGPGQLLIVENYTEGLGFCITNNTPLWDDPSKSIILPNGNWCPTSEGEQIWLRLNGHGDWVEVLRVITSGPGFAIINPTIGRLPYKDSTNSFGDSPLNYGNAYTVELISSQPNAPNFVLRATDTNANTGFLSVNQSDAAGNADVIWVNGLKSGSSWDGSGTSRDGELSFNVLSDDVMVQRFLLDGDSGLWTMYDRSGVLNFSVENASGYTGTGAKWLSDDGTYSVPGTSGITMNPTDGRVPYRFDATTFADSLLEYRTTNYSTLHGFGAGLFIGSHAEAWYGSGLTGEAIVAANIVAEGDPDDLEMLITSVDGSNSGEFHVSGSSEGITVDLSVNGASPSQLHLSSKGISQRLDTGDFYFNVDPFGLHGPTPFYFNVGASYGSTDPLAEIEYQGARQFYLQIDSGYTGAGTLFLSDDGTYKAAGGPGGSSLWANVAGVLQPIGGQTTNALLFTSGSSDAATNTAFTVDTVNVWTDASSKLQQWRNVGTNVAYITPNGSIEIGRSIVDWWAPDETDILAGVHDVAQGESDYSGLHIAAIDDASDPVNWASFTVTANTGATPAIISTFKASTNAVDSSFEIFLQPEANVARLTLTDKGNTAFAVADNSGYTGAGTLFLSDDGTYKAAGGTAGTVINTGASTVGQFAQYTDTTGTNVAPHTLTSGDVTTALGFTPQAVGGGNIYFGYMLTPWLNTNSTLTLTWRNAPQVWEFGNGLAGEWIAITANSGTTSAGTSDGLDNGVASLSTSTSTNGVAGTRFLATSFRFGSDTVAIHWRVKTTTLGSDADGYQYFIGAHDISGDAVPTDGAYFFYQHSISNGVWTAKTVNNTFETFASGGAGTTTVAANTWYDLMMSGNSSVVNFWVSADSGATWQFLGYSTGNIPSASGRETGIGSYIRKIGGSVGTTTRTLTLGRCVYWP